MIHTEIASVQSVHGHGFNPRDKAQSFTGRLASVDSTMSVFFESGRCRLPEPEIEALAHWINSWNTVNSRRHLMIGGAHETSRTNRLRRLGFILSLLQQLGVPQQRVHPDEDWMTPMRMGSMDDVPVDEVWLQLRESQSS